MAKHQLSPIDETIKGCEADYTPDEIWGIYKTICRKNKTPVDINEKDDIVQQVLQFFATNSLDEETQQHMELINTPVNVVELLAKRHESTFKGGNDKHTFQWKHFSPPDIICSSFAVAIEVLRKSGFVLADKKSTVMHISELEPDMDDKQYRAAHNRAKLISTFMKEDEKGKLRKENAADAVLSCIVGERTLPTATIGFDYNKPYGYYDPTEGVKNFARDNGLVPNDEPINDDIIRVFCAYTALLAERNTNAMKVVLGHIARAYNKPTQRDTPFMWGILGVEGGEGKGVYFDLLDGIFGERSLAASERLFQSQFNGELAGKVIVQFKDCPQLKSREVIKLLSITGDSQLQIEQKYAAPYIMPNYLRVILATNQYKLFNELHVGMKRRAILTRASSMLKGNYAFFQWITTHRDRICQTVVNWFDRDWKEIATYPVDMLRTIYGQSFDAMAVEHIGRMFLGMKRTVFEQKIGLDTGVSKFGKSKGHDVYKIRIHDMTNVVRQLDENSRIRDATEAIKQLVSGRPDVMWFTKVQGYPTLNIRYEKLVSVEQDSIVNSVNTMTEPIETFGLPEFFKAAPDYIDDSYTSIDGMSDALSRLMSSTVYEEYQKYLQDATILTDIQGMVVEEDEFENIQEEPEDLVF